MFDGSRYEIRQRFGLTNKYAVYEDGADEPFLESAQKRFRLKEDFRFTDPGTDEEVIRVKADSALDLAATYDVVDSRTDERIGAVRRKVKSVFKHEYDLLDADGDVVATLKEDSVLSALVRRYVTTLLPFSYVVESPTGERVGEVSGALSIRDRYTVDVSGDLDPRLAVVAAVVVDAIEEN